MTNTIQWAEAANTIQQAMTILVVAHVFPDGDAIGSLLGLTHALSEIGKTVTAAVDGGVPENLMFCPGSELVQSELEMGAWDLMISTDASDETRSGKCGAYGRANSKTVINLDHHPTNTLFGDILLVVPEAVAATEIVFDLLEMIPYSTMSTNVAQSLLLGLVTDTLGFRTSGVNAKTLGIAQALMAVGANLSHIMRQTLEKHSYQVLNIWKQALPRVELHDQIIETWLTLEDAKQVGMDEVSDGGLVSFLNTIHEASVAVIFRETPQGQVEISLRSKPGFDVGALALALGGGGHKQASGATIDGPIEVARERIMPLLREVVKQGKPTRV